MRLKIICLIFALAICLSGCRYFTYVSYSTGSTMLGGGRYWNKKGLDDKEMSQFYWKCYSGMAEMYNKARKDKTPMDSNLIVELEIEGQKCMLAHGFTFKDASYPDGKLCSRSYAKNKSLKSYMIFPACQAKYGKYRK